MQVCILRSVVDPNADQVEFGTFDLVGSRSESGSYLNDINISTVDTFLSLKMVKFVVNLTIISLKNLRKTLQLLLQSYN
jgi:hypothetical protein